MTVPRTALRRTQAGAAIALLVTISACAGSADSGDSDDAASGGSTSITFRSWSPIEQTTRQMIDSFTEANPDVSIDATIFNYPEYLVDLQTRASSGTMPDLVGLQPGAMTQQFRENLMPLEECAADTWGENWQDKFYPIGLEQSRMGNPEGDDSFYSLPLLVQTVNLWANTEIFDEAGLEPPTTWAELETTVDELSGGDAAPFLLPGKDAWLRNVVFLQIANNIEPGLVYQAETGEVDWTHPRIVEAFEYWGRLFTDGIAQDGALALDAYPNGVNQFEAGDAAMIPLGAWWIQQSDPTRADIPPLSDGMAGYEPFLFPTIPGGAEEPQLVGGVDVALGISSETKNPELACQVLTDWIDGAGTQVLINTFNDLPAVDGVNPEEFTSERQEQIWTMFTEEWMPEVKWSRYFASPDIDTAVADALAGVGAGELTPQEAVESVQKVQEEAN